MTSKPPTDWELKTIDEIVGKITSGGTPKVGTSEYYNGNIPFLKINDLTRVSKFVYSADEHITQKAIDETSAKIFPAGTVVTTMYGTIGITRILAKPMATNQAIAAFLNLRGVVPDFLHHKISHETRRLITKSAQTTQANISATLLKEHEIELPPIEEQQKIAEILTSVDEVIEKTQSQINKLEDLKKATMNEVLTKGIGHTEFKETEIGRIPKSWEIQVLEKIGKWVGGGTPSKDNPLFWKNGTIPWVSPKDMKVNKLGHSEDKITESALKNSTAQLIPAGSLLIVFRSGILKHSLPVAENLVDVTINQDMKAVQCGPYLLVSYLRLWFGEKEQQLLKQCSKIGTTVESMDWDSLKLISILVPPLQEQTHVVEVLESIEHRIQVLQVHQSHSYSLKNSLMQDLLTGKVRVTVN